VVTGFDGLYRYFKLDGPNLKVLPVQIHKRDSDSLSSHNYTCHTWLNDGKFIICNDHGQIMLLD